MGRHGAGQSGAGLLVGDEDAAVDQLWLATLGRIASRGAHEIKGALNGVSVNLEVVRSRAAKQDAPATAVQKFAESASEQLEGLTRMSEALLALARPMRQPADISTVLKRLVALLGPATAAEGGRLVLEPLPEVPGEVGGSAWTTSVPANAMRVVLASALLAAIERKGEAGCRAELGDSVVIHVTCATGGAPELAPAILDAASGAGIGVERDGGHLSLAFPRAARTPSLERA